jgi:hypothetical protein
MSRLEKDEKNIKPKYNNHLIHEKSPYLQQHAHNPVNWYPWGDEAFRIAKKENKPIFLSIGYSTCHWCHVMAHESFEDPEIGKIINKVFVPIKVDREERPEIDNIFMNICQMMTGSGGWPLTIVLTPDKKPFFAGTYFSKESEYGRVGLKEIIISVQDLWNNNPKEAIQSSEKIVNVLKKISHNVPGADLQEEILENTYNALHESFDLKYGGFGMIQKFPSPTNIYFLLRHWKRTSNDNSLNMVLLTLDKMQQGGIYDHIGFGFHRYSVDPTWLVPHFEKMLYDQALISMAYLEAFQITGNPMYNKTVNQILEYVIRDLKSVEGGFYSAEDADSEGEEGKFYLWEKSEIKNILGDDADLMCELYQVSDKGNYKEESTGKQTGKNILHLKEPVADFALRKNLTEEDLHEKILKSRGKLFQKRKMRIHPQKDDKILTDWNGLIIAALSKAYQVFGNKSHKESAQKAADFILDKMYDDGKLMHRYKDGEAAISGNLDDYAFLIWGLMELYQATFNIKYLEASFNLNKTLMEHFLDKKSGGFYFTADYAEEIILRKKESYDSAVPSGNSVQMLNLLKMAKLSEDESLKDVAIGIEKYFSEKIKRSPLAHTHMINAINFRFGPSYDVVIACDGEKESVIAQEKLQNVLATKFLPNILWMDVSLIKEKKFPFNIPDYLMAKKALEGNCTYYICSDTDCKPPLFNVEEIVDILDN